MKYCIITLNWDGPVVMLSIGMLCGARYAISDCLVVFEIVIIHVLLFKI